MDHGGAITRQNKAVRSGIMVTARVGRAGTDHQEADWGGFPEKVTLDFLGITVLNKESGLNSSETSEDPESGRKGIETEESENRDRPGCADSVLPCKRGWGRVKDGLGLCFSQ